MASFAPLHLNQLDVDVDLPSALGACLISEQGNRERGRAQP